jgi:hypothetical protein
MRPKRTSPLPRVALVCIRCDKPFTRTAGEIRKYPNAPTFCSRACYRPTSPPVLSPDGDVAAVPLYGQDGTIRVYAYVDAADIGIVTTHRWHLCGGYAERKEWRDGQSVGIYMHRDLLGLPTPTDGREVDHIDRDRLNCRRSNMRIVTHPQNTQNHPGYGGASRHRGVQWNKLSGKWQVRVMVDGKNHHIGMFATEQEAAEAARAARARLMPYATD